MATFARRIQVRATCDLSTMASKSARAPSLRAILSLAFPVTFGHITACRTQALTFSATIYFTMKRSDPCSAVLRYSPSSWAAVAHRSALIPKALRSSRRHPIHSFSCPPTQPTLPTSSPNTTHFSSLVSSMRAKYPADKILLLRIVASML